MIYYIIPALNPQTSLLVINERSVEVRLFFPAEKGREGEGKRKKVKRYEEGKTRKKAFSIKNSCLPGYLSDLFIKR